MKFTRNNKLSLVLLAVYLLITARGSSRCPSNCRCNATYVSCVEKDLEEIPEFSDIRSKVIYMDFSRNDIETIYEYSFQFNGVAQIKELRINENSIMDVESNSFIKLINLELLDLHDNLIGIIPRDIVKYNKRLKTLDLSHNLFTKTTPIIESESLIAFDLSYTRISTFDDENINYLPKLQILHLYHNNLKFISSDILLKNTNLFYVELASNVWNCDCATIKLFDSLIKRNITKIDTIQCRRNDNNYIDIYNKDGPIYTNDTCRNNVNDSQVNVYETIINIDNNTGATSDYYKDLCNDFFCNNVNYMIIVTVTVISIIALIGIILMLILFKVRKYQRVELISYEMKTTSC